MGAILREPIGRINALHEPLNKRLSLEYITNVPFARHTHSTSRLEAKNSNNNQLVLLTRNPIELFLREFAFQDETFFNSHSPEKMDEFITRYMARLSLFERWNEGNRYLLFYDDLIVDFEGCLLAVLEFMGKNPIYWDDFVLNKQMYLDKIRASYILQFKTSGKSSKNGPKAIYYTKNQSVSLLKKIEKKFYDEDPVLFNKYLKRFET